MNSVRKLFFTLLVLVVFFGGLELTLDSLGWPSVEDSRVFEHDRIFWVEDSNLVRHETPHREIGGSFTVTTDANGLRAPLHSEDKPRKTFRIMTMGCSTTFGWGVNDHESYPARLEETLLERGYSHVEIVNGAQPGYTTFQGRWLWEDRLREYDPDLVILGFVIQDARKVAYSDLSQALLQSEGEFLKRNFLYRSKIYLGLRELVGDVQLRAKESSQQVYRVSGEEYLENLRVLRSAVRSVGAKVMHFGFPLERVGYTELHRQILRYEAQSAEIPWFDPSVEMEALSRNRTLYFPKDRGHANAEGCQVIATMMADFLEEKGLVEKRQ